MEIDKYKSEEARVLKLQKTVREYPDVHKTNVLFLTVQAAVIPTSDFPAPQGSTIIPDLARLVKY